MRVQPADLELWLTDYVRDAAAADKKQVLVSNKEPQTLALPLSKPLIILRDDPGARLSAVTFDHSIGFSILAGSKRNDRPAKDLARWLAGVLFDADIVLVQGSPIAAVIEDGCISPAAVTENLDVARQYGTAQYVVSGAW